MIANVLKNECLVTKTMLFYDPTCQSFWWASLVKNSKIYNLGIKIVDIESDNQISKIIQEKLIDLHGSKGYKSIIQTMVKISGKTENHIISN